MNHFLKYVSILFVAIGISSVCIAQSSRNLLKHFSHQEIAQSLVPISQWHPFPQSSAEWQNILPDSIQEKIISRARQISTLSFQSLPASLMLEYVRTGNRTHYEAVSFGKREQLFDLALAESIEQKGRFINAIADGIWSVCEESFWGVPAHLSLQKAGTGLADAEDPVVDLFSAETAATLALTDYLVGKELDTISPLLRKRIYYEVNRRILTPLEKESNRYWYFSTKANNWNPWITSNWMISLLLLEKNENRRANELHHAMILTDQYLNKLSDDGASDEGPSYWFDAVGRLFDGLSIIKSATANRIAIFQEPFIKRIASYIYKVHISGDYFISIADASPVIKPDGLLLYRFGEAIDDTTLKNFGAWLFHRNYDLFDREFTMADRLWNFTVMSGCAKDEGRQPQLDDVWLKDVHLMIARTSAGMFIASHGGHNAESHNHNDVGDIILYLEGTPVIIDAGAGTYTAKTFSNERYTLWYNTSAYHNLPTINGFQQQAGRQFEAKQLLYNSTPSFTRLQMDIAAAYPTQAGIKQWVRTIELEKNSNRVTVTDRYVSNGPLKQLMQTFMTVCPADIRQPGKILFSIADKKVLLEYDPAAWEVSKEEVLKHSPDEKRLEDNWHGPIWRILLTCRKFSSKGSFTYTFSKIETTKAIK